MLAFVLLGIILFLGFLLWSKKRPKEEIAPQEPVKEKTRIARSEYVSLNEAEDQIKGKVTENQAGVIVIEETAPKQRKIRLGEEDFEALKLQKIVTKDGFEKSKMDEIQAKIKSIRKKKSEELTKDNSDAAKITVYDNELLKLLDEETFSLVEQKEAKIEDFAVGSEITFSRIGKNNFQLIVYPSEFPVYFPE